MKKPVSERNTQRRRILKMAASAPVVLTLPTGAAMAAASIGCEVKSFNAFNPGEVDGFASGSGDPSSWMRMRLPKLLMRAVSDDGGAGDAGRVPGFEFNGDYYEVSDDVASPFVPNHSGANAPEDTGEFYYALVDYHEGGVTLVLDKHAPGVNPIAGASCWNSLIAGASLNTNVIN